MIQLKKLLEVHFNHRDRKECTENTEKNGQTITTLWGKAFKL